jgi:deoxyribodipyrimidine photo-lyase
MLQVVWLKRDLRWEDHAPLRAALATAEPVVVLVLHEPSIWSSPVYSNRHARFVWESVSELRKTAPLVGSSSHEPGGPQPIPVFHLWAEAQEAFEAIESLAGIPLSAVHSHQEVGIACTYDRDRSIKKWLDHREIPWIETPYGSVRRGLKRREDWNAHWNHIMFKEPLAQADWSTGQAWTPCLQWMKWAESREVPPPEREEGIAQTGGPSWGQRYLRTFLEDGRGRGYMAHISKPEGAKTHCSRLSTYLAWGNLSLKQVVRALAEASGDQMLATRDARGFASRLRWREHFIQKFETECRMEFEHVNRGYQNQEFSQNSAHLEAWKRGQTGVPMVDACMRSLNETGYLNFRMRAMLVSFACHALNLHWKDISAHLAQQFLDFEPGIHYPQLQMQAAVTGVNTVRIYNPMKQALEQDPQGEFLKKWLPELRPLPMPFCTAPWMLTQIDCVAFEFQRGLDYPEPLVDLKKSLSEARMRLYAAKKRPEVRAEKTRILDAHVAPNRRRAKKA